ncbi:Ubiquitin carboxyl-terminal hydrolase 43 [Anabarilius grahami]|uniref:ubiquitinyl hydrolase 1 n=1 Tax=Anabarilius grahami TaxID=495550 RepID=A0A3N0Y9L9_ANAGA|nr:Ubiquitin carboxyl-terminal hydrolase 43 [Anabarilius grahami]
MDKRDKKAKKDSGKSTKRTGKLFRRKSFKSVESLVSKILKSLGSLASGGETTERSDAEDDDGGFGESAPCAGNSGHVKKEDSSQVRKSSSLPCRSSAIERLCSLYGDNTPGVLGLKNHGNTCFMNAVVQCLSNTDLLAEYLGLERYKLDLCHRGMNGFIRSEDERGEVTERLATLVRALWTFQYTPQLSAEFKMTVSKYGAQFRGNSQHDALEFLLWLLDRLHEDINSSSTIPNGNNRSKSSGKAIFMGTEIDLKPIAFCRSTCGNGFHSSWTSNGATSPWQQVAEPSAIIATREETRYMYLLFITLILHCV